MNRFIQVTLIALLPAAGFAADDDMVVDGPILPNDAQQQMEHLGVVDFDQWLFQPSGNARQGQQRLETQVKLQLAELDRIGELTAAQKQKLELAARGDLQRFLDDADALRRKFNAAVKKDPNAANQMWQEIQPLQARQARGLTGPGSLLAKVIPTTLTPEQSLKYEAVTGERRKFRYQASIAVALHQLESSVALNGEQRDALRKLLLELPPPKAFGQYDHYLIMYRLAMMPPDKIQSLLDARQWTAMKQQLDQQRGMREFLIQQGMLTREELAEPFLAAPAGGAEP
jgi:hypothetical protein